jgi:hypothetical protein
VSPNKIGISQTLGASSSNRKLLQKKGQMTAQSFPVLLEQSNEKSEKALRRLCDQYKLNFDTVRHQ